MNCKICGKKSEGEYCFLHKKRKPLPKNKIQRKDDGMKSFFLVIWNKRLHFCEECGKWLGKEPLSYMFDHILEKSKYPELKYEEENISLLCLKCHDKKTRGFYSDEYKEKINKTKELFGK